MEAPERRGNPISFPCIENPFRVSLSCNGHYLVCLNRRGKMGARRRRTMGKSEFQLIETDSHVMLVNQKFGSVLSLMGGDSTAKRRHVRCLRQQTNSDDQTTTDLDMSDDLTMEDTEEKDIEDGSSQIDEKAEDQAEPELNCASSTAEDDKVDEELDDNENDDDDNDRTLPIVPIESQKWELTKQVDGHFCMKNAGTGDRLGIDGRGRPVLFAETDSNPNISHVIWRIQPETGELCFLSNVTHGARMRCDMSGRLSLSSNWKGWEVFRFLEAGDGFVTVSSWAHSHWILQCNGSGKLQTGTQSADQEEGEWDSLWAVELASNGNGVVLRSRRYGRFLCVNTGRRALNLGTYHPFDELRDHAYGHGDKSKKSDAKMSAKSISSQDNLLRQAIASKSSEKASQADLLQQALARSKTNDTGKRRGWFRRRGKESTIPNDQPLPNNTDLLPSEDVSESIVWRLEAAHRQQYSLSSKVPEDPSTMSIGPFPHVTRNLRKADKFHLIRRSLGKADESRIITQLCYVRENKFIACSSDGNISLISDAHDSGTEWIVVESKELGGSGFLSKDFGYFLSYGADARREASERSAKLPNTKDGADNGLTPKNRPELLGSKELGTRGCWNLAPCVPRAVNSRKVRAFAIGTSLVLGSSFVLPFALVGAGAMLHIGGNAGVAYHLVVAGISSADAVSSVGALGATAYVVFSAQDLSVTDQKKESGGGEKSIQDLARFNRPFCDWRNWDTQE
eukprot:scaffold6032_cov100-Cylindrotheca_fusiformis.AAC.5